MSIPPPNDPPPPPPSSPQPPSPEPARYRRLMGAGIGVAFMIVLVGGGLVWSGSGALVIIGFVLAVVASTLAMFSARFRPYAVGFLIAVGLVIIVIGGACIGLIASLSSQWA